MVLIVALVVIILASIVVYFAIGNYFYNFALCTSKDKTIILGEKTPEYKKWVKDGNEWISKKSKDVYIESTNNGKLKLHAYEIRSKENSNVWAILIHGYMGAAHLMVDHAKEFEKKGYNILMIELRGHGLSDGNYVGMGWHDRLDTIDWINYILKKDSESKIFLFGVSMGAATVMMTLGEKLPKNVKFAVADCGYSSVWDEFSERLKDMYKIKLFPVLSAANTVCKLRAKYSFKEASSVKQLKKAEIPILFIHGLNDTFVPFEMLNKNYNAAKSAKEKLVIEGASHAESIYINPELYFEKVYNFINKYLT